jgi:hypothetical protein
MRQVRRRRCRIPARQPGYLPGRDPASTTDSPEAAAVDSVFTPGCSHRAAVDDSTFASVSATPFQTHVKPRKNPAPYTSKTAFSPAVAVASPPTPPPPPPLTRTATGASRNSTSIPRQHLHAPRRDDARGGEPRGRERRVAFHIMSAARAQHGEGGVVVADGRDGAEDASSGAVVEPPGQRGERWRGRARRSVHPRRSPA